MAEAIGIAGSIVGIAGAGIAVVSALTKFSISIRGSNDKINYLAGRVSLTVSILEDIAGTVKSHSSGFKKREFWKTWGSVLDACEESYARIDAAVAKARGKRNDEKKISVWGKLVWALGGEAEMRDLEASLERCCQQVMMMQQAVQLSVLSLLHQLTSDEAAERRELMGKLEWLLSGLSATGHLVLPGVSSEERPFVVVHDNHLPEDIAASEVNYSGSKVPLPDGPIGPRGGLFGTTGDGSSKPMSQGLSSLFVMPSRPKPSTSPSQESTSQVPEESAKRRPFFEAFYIIPRSLPRHQEKGEVQIAKPSADDYMIICVDARSDYYKDKNVRDAIRRAKRGGDQPNIDEFPGIVRETARWLTDHRKDHTSGVKWKLVYGIELDYLDESFFRRSSSKSGFLIVIRGVRESDGVECTYSSYSRSRSRSRASEPPFVERGSTRYKETPLIINNRVYNDYEVETDDRYLEVARSRRNSRSGSRSSAGDSELERNRRDSKSYKGDEKERMRKELELMKMKESTEIRSKYRPESYVEYGKTPVIVDHKIPKPFGAEPQTTDSIKPDNGRPSHHYERESRYYDDKRYSPPGQPAEYVGKHKSRDRPSSIAALGVAGLGATAIAGSRRRARSETMEFRRSSSLPRRGGRWASDDESDITLPTTLVNEERGRRQETEVHVSQQQAETMVMDFLATFADVKRSSY